VDTVKKLENKEGQPTTNAGCPILSRFFYERVGDKGSHFRADVHVSPAKALTLYANCAGRAG